MTSLSTRHTLVLWGLCFLAFATGRGFAAQRALPRGVVEIPGTNVQSLVALTDGTLVGNNGRVSRDAGQTWPEVRSFGAAGGAGIMRLLSGKLALVDPVGYASGTMWLSADEGKTWTKAGPIRVPGGPVFELGDTMVQLKQGPHKGRLLYCWDINVAGEHPGMEYATMQARGRWKGHDYAVEGHTHIPEFYGSGFSWSDDEGRSWNYATFQNMPNILMGWFDFHGEVNGTCGVTPTGEASLAETRDGRILFFGRSTVGRVVQSFSSNSGERWLALRPSALAASNAPPRLRCIPGTADLLCIWNQVSPEEIRRGFRRGRLSAAISRNGGATWENFKTIECCEGLENTPRVTPDAEIRLVRARPNVGNLPDGFAYYHYANVNFAGDRVYIMYLRGHPSMGIAEQMLEKQENVMRIYSLKWFYEQ